MLLGSTPGRVVGPYRNSQGWSFARLDGIAAAPDTLLNDQTRGQLTTDILSARQRQFFDSYISKLRESSQVADLRGSGRSY